MNDLELASDGLVLVGHEYAPTTEKDCWPNKPCGAIKGMMMKLDAQGSFQWKKSYGNYPDGINQFAESGEGDWGLIYNECWGVAKTYDSSGAANGYALACGTGIENCAIGLMQPGLYLECKNDPRKIWRDLTVATDLNGERVWSRMDNF